MRPFLRFAPVLALLAACGDGPLQPGPFTLDGTWQGSARPYQLFLELSQDGDNNVDGTGEIRTFTVTNVQTRPRPSDPTRLDTISADTNIVNRVTVEVEGDWDYQDFTLALRSEGFADVVYAGRWSGTSPDSITGNLNGSGFDTDAVPLIRQSQD